MAFDKKDRMILMGLQQNAKQSSRDLSKKLNMPATTIHERIKKMETEGIITGYHVAIDYEKVGMPTTAIILVRRMPRTVSDRKVLYKKIADLTAKIPDIQEAHIVTGEYDMVLKIRGKNEKEVGAFIVDTIWNMPEVERTLTLMTFYTAKDTCRLELK
ncbi:TPA: Lrp/AsnC family transcriptional regulator [archaeon]|uniref:Lrp/AsnC family transcriptional regulator n=1 Tax=Candidatus Naiadarchaeum limnaeum TaxID=2756139 RepID=A0A832V546_9ARCH|nr:Lrp/AsnC family transcriptional regulator [Candidatus Naiadarchaeales archaeon SRR2090153.bin1042]HIK00435.1 Lrp/AsnC family transcriptional regulator [Candidatus Naiadarchaeum limnaeum]